MTMSDNRYYLGDPCYVIPDDEWDEFCEVMNYEADTFEFKGESCRTIGTGGDGDFGGLSVDAGIIGVVPLSVCDPTLVQQASGHSRIISNFAELEFHRGDIIVVDGEALNAYECECDYHRGQGGAEWIAHGDEEECYSCGRILSWDCAEYNSNNDAFCNRCEDEMADD